MFAFSRSLFISNSSVIISNRMLYCVSHIKTATFIRVNPPNVLLANVNITSKVLVRYSSFSTIKCWNCGKIHESSLFCDKCNVLQEPHQELDYFKLMGVAPKFDVEESELVKKYKSLQRQLHPDKYGNKSKEEQRISQEYSSLVNKAYSTLLRPLSRGIYMLKLRGCEIPEKTEAASDFLSEMMERNEEVEEATTKEEITKLNQRNRREIETLCKEVAAVFNSGDTNEISRALTRLKYYDSLDTEIKKVLRRMGIVE